MCGQASATAMKRVPSQKTATAVPATSTRRPRPFTQRAISPARTQESVTDAKRDLRRRRAHRRTGRDAIDPGTDRGVAIVGKDRVERQRRDERRDEPGIGEREDVTAEVAPALKLGLEPREMLVHLHL